MIDLKEKLVKVFFKTGQTAEGIVRSWTSGLSILDNPVGPGYLIIHDTLQNIMMVRVLGEMAPAEPPINWKEPIKTKVLRPPPNELSTDPILRARKFAELKQQEIQQHKAQVKERLQRGTVVGATTTTEVNYEYPDLTKLKSIHNTTKKNSNSAGRKSSKV